MPAWALTHFPKNPYIAPMPKEKTLSISPAEAQLFEMAQANAERAHSKHLSHVPMIRSGRSFPRYSYQSEAVQLFRDCNGNSDQISDPRGNLELSRAMWNAIPVFRNADKRLQDAMGKAYPMSDNPQLLAVLEDLWQEFTYQSNRNPVSHKGINKAVRAGITSMHRNGMGFGELFRTGGAIRGVRIPDPALFDHRLNPDQSVSLIMMTPTEGEKVIETMSNYFLQWTGEELEEEYFYWGQSMPYKAISIASSYIRAVKARKFGWIRTSTPPTLTTISGGVSNDQGSQYIDRNVKESYERFSSDYKDKYEQGFQRAVRTGEPFDIVADLLGDFKIDTKTYGEGVRPFTDFEQELQFWSVMFGIATGVPAEYMGFPFSTGISSHRFQMLKAIMNANGGRMQDDQSHVFRQIVTQHLISIRANPEWLEHDAWSLHWEPMAPELMLEDAQANKVNAEAVTMQMTNLMTMNMAGATEEAIAYAEEIGRPGLSDVTDGAGGQIEEEEVI